MERRVVGSRTNDQGDVIPVWSPRVKMSKIRQLYESDARGIHDEELLDTVGYGLLCRCESFVVAPEASMGRPICPGCGEIVVREMRDDEVLRCTCGWRLSWQGYFRTIHPRQQLIGGGQTLIGPFRDFTEAFPRASSYQEKMVLVDQLIHRSHGYIESIRTDD